MKVTGSIIVDRVKIYARHGVDPQEQKTGAYFYVTMEAKTDFSQALHTDNLEHTVSYADLFQIIKEEMATPSLLLEHVAGRIVASTFHRHPNIQRIRISIIKENPPIGAECKGAGIHLEAEQ
jgi:dihydroneopterin aldolase